MKFRDRSVETAETRIFAAVFIWFLLQISFFAVRIADTISPDEPHHFEISMLWAKGGFELPINPDMYRYGAVSRFPYLYHALMGWLSKLNVIGIEPIVFLRLMNVIISAAAFYISWKFLKEVVACAATRIAVLFIMASTLMFVFISGMVSYDNLVFFLAVVCFYCLARFLKTRRLGDFLRLHTASMAGCLVKFTFLPLSLFFGVVTLFAGKKQLLAKSSWKEFTHSRSNYLVLAIAGVFLLLNLNLYLTNLTKFDGIYPSCESVLGKEICDAHYGQHIREKQLIEQNKDKERMDFPTYLKQYLLRAEETIVPIVGHKGIALRLVREKYPHRLVFFLSLVSLIIISTRKDWAFFRDRNWLVCIVASIWYMSVVIWDNHRSYMSMGQFGVGLQGRYLFPILLPFLYAVCRPIFHWVRAGQRWVMLVLIMLIMSPSGFAIFLRYASKSWYRP